MFQVIKLVSKKTGREYVALCFNGRPICFDRLIICECCQVVPSRLDEMKVGDVLPIIHKPK